MRFNDNYSNFLPGFSTDIVPRVRRRPVLIVAESHGGRDREDFKNEDIALEEEMNRLGSFYRDNELQNFHQLAMRYLFDELDRDGIPWVFTDLVKCFVYKGNKAKKDNWEPAIKYCSKFLEEQIDILQPEKILVLGSEVRDRYFLVDKEDRKKYLGENEPHGFGFSKSVRNREQNLVLSYFPSQRTVDKFIRLGWDGVVAKLKR